MLEAVIFDMDGVIIDSEPIHKTINQRIYEELCIEVPAEEYSTFVGVTDFKMWSYLKEKNNLKHTVDELVRMQFDRTLEHLSNCSEKPIPGVVELLKELKERGIPAALASSSRLDAIKTVIKLFNINEYFKFIISGDNVKRGKPDPEIFLSAAKALKVDPKNCVVIEDSSNGVKAAKAAGMKCIGFKNLNSGDQDISSADMIVDDLRNVSFEVIRKLTED